MKRVACLFVLLLILAVVVIGSFYGYVRTQRDNGAVSSALLAGFTSLSPHPITYGEETSDPSCRQAYHYLKGHTGVCLIEDSGSSRFSPKENTVYLPHADFSADTAASAHEFGHALDWFLRGESPQYYSRQETFSHAYAADCSRMQETFLVQRLFETEAYRNPAVSDILFAVFYGNEEMTRVLTASYNTAGVSYWQHEESYMRELHNRQTEVFADIFTIWLSDDAEAKAFLQTFLPQSSRTLLEQVQTQRW